MCVLPVRVCVGMDGYVIVIKGWLCVIALTSTMGLTLLPSQIEAALPYLDELAFAAGSKEAAAGILTEGKDKIGSKKILRQAETRTPLCLPGQKIIIIIQTGNWLDSLSLFLSLGHRGPNCFFDTALIAGCNILLRLCFRVRVYKWTPLLILPPKNYSHPTIMANHLLEFKKVYLT